MSLHFTRRDSGWYRGRGARHHYTIIRDRSLWRLTTYREDLSVVSADLYPTMTFAKQVAAEFEANQALSCDCMIEDLHDGLGERVVEHSLRCPLHPEHDGDLP